MRCFRPVVKKQWTPAGALVEVVHVAKGSGVQKSVDLVLQNVVEPPLCRQLARLDLGEK
jgi:hypothetical protein